jgi:hypothetical protein
MQQRMKQESGEKQDEEPMNHGMQLHGMER